jgi:dihydrofolate reductase
MPPVVIVAALARNRVIGRDNRLIWRLKSDMKHFRALTMGKPMIMGRKTFDSIGKPLPGRQTIVITRDAGLEIPGVEVVTSLTAAREAAARAAREMGVNEVIVAGGAEIYAAFLPEAERLELTEVALSPPGDALFPEFSVSDWREIRKIGHKAGPDDETDFAFVTYARR